MGENNAELERIGRTEALFREVNERIAESAERFEADEAEFVCECGDPSCTTRVLATLDEYEDVRGDSVAFLLAHGHEDARVEGVVEMDARHSVVHKTHPNIVPLVRALDPRAA